MFLNLSNHPTASWTEPQLAAAGGNVVDLAFPQVDPDGDETYIEQLANDYYNKINAMPNIETVHIMGEMTKCLAEPREDYKPFVPRIVQIEIPSDFIGAVIGKGGETIQKIQKETGTTITITEEDGKGIVDIFGVDKDAMDKALAWIEGICAVPEVGTTYHGKVVSILEFGAFIEILPGKEGLLHVSEIAWNKTENVTDVLSVGQEVDVKLLEIDEKTGKMRLSMRALTEKPEGYKEPERRPRGERREGGERRERREGGERGPRRERGDRAPRRPVSPRREQRPAPEPKQNNEPEIF